jgi:hypothetical protein
MSRALQDFLDPRLPLPGVAAWVARLADHSLAQEIFADWFTPGQLEQMLTRLVLAGENLARHQIQPVQVCWVFEHARIHLAARPDGAYLALFVENHAGLPTDALTQVLADFLALPQL